MDDVRPARFYLCCFALFALIGAALPASAEVDYISPARTTELENQFASAKPADVTALTHFTKWTCDMYGMRSKLQVQRGLDLYAFSASKTDASALNNSGDAPVTRFARHGDAFEGTTDKGVLDQLRVTADGHLVGKLSLPAHKLTIAYAVCAGS